MGVYLTESFVEKYRNLIRKAENSVLDALKLQEVRQSNMPIMMDDDGTRFPVSYPDMQVSESTKEGIYRQQVKALCEGLSNLCRASSFTLDSELLKEFNDVFDIYKSRYPYESMFFLHEYMKGTKDIPESISALYDSLSRSEDQAIQAGGKAYGSKTKSDVMSMALLSDFISSSVSKLKNGA